MTTITKPSPPPALANAARPADASAGLTFRDFSMVLALAAIWIFFAVKNPAFLSSRNLSNLAVELSITAVLALGMLLIIVPGHIDLSIGSGVGLLGGIAAVLIFEYRWPAPLAMALATLIGLITWSAIGALIIKQRIPAFIVTLAGLLIFKGLHWLVIHDATIPIAIGSDTNAMSLLTTWYLPPLLGLILTAAVIIIMIWSTIQSRRKRLSFGFELESADIAFGKLVIVGQMLFLFTLVCNNYRGVPLSALILATVAGLTGLVTSHTRFGRYLFAIGGNEEAAIISGVPINRVVIGAFGIMGLLVALGGFLQTAYAGSSTTTIGQLLELDAVAACVIGGTSLKGGRGTVSGVLFGVLIMASLLNGLTLIAASPEIKFIARGLVLASAVWMDIALANRKAH